MTNYYNYDGKLLPQSPTPSDTEQLPGGSSASGTLEGTSGNDGMWGGDGVDMYGNGGSDTYYLLSLKDQVFANSDGGVNSIVSWISVDLNNYANVQNLTVSNGNVGYGTPGDNILVSGGGGNELYGGGGDDVLVGGAGRDVFIVDKGQGNDVIYNFSTADGDIVRLTAGFTDFSQVQSHLIQQGSDVLLDMGGGNGLIFRGMTVSQLSANNFQLQFDPSQLGAMTFDEEFSNPLSLYDATNAPNGTWRPDFGGDPQSEYTYTLNDESEVYTSPYFRGAPGNYPDNPFTINSDGTLSISATPTTDPNLWNHPYYSGTIQSQPSFSQEYGYFEIRAKPPTQQGDWSAFWLLPQNGWPPEADIMETWSPFKDSSLSALHYADSSGSAISAAENELTPRTSDGYHTYGLLWTPTTLDWYIDGVEVWTQPTPDDMHQPMYMIANLAIYDEGNGTPADTTQLKIDYIHAYAIPGVTVMGPGSISSQEDPSTGLAGIGSSSGGSTSGGGTSGGGTTSGQTLQAPNDSGTTLTGGSGNDTLIASHGPDTLTGGAGADTFEFPVIPWSAGKVTDFTPGTDFLDLAPLFQGAGYTGTDPVKDGWLSFASDGKGDTLVYFNPHDGSNGGYPYQITTLDGVAPSSIVESRDVIFTGSTSTTGGGTSGGGTSGGGTTGGGTTGGGTTSGQTLQAPNDSGTTLTGGSGNDTLIASHGPDILTGGGGADTFEFPVIPWSAGQVTDFTPGTDFLDLAPLFQGAGYTGTDPVKDGWLSFASDGKGDTLVYFNPHNGSNGGYPYLITTLDKVAPSSIVESRDVQFSGSTSSSGGGTSSGGTTTGQTLQAPNDSGTTLTGGAGDDTLIASHGPDTLTGAGGADTFQYPVLPWSAGQVTDFTPDTDYLDLSKLFHTAGYTGTNPIKDGWVSFASDGKGDTLVYFNPHNGSNSGYPYLITTLDHVTPASIVPSHDLIFS